MQTEQERRCSSCGADNKAGASFCWRCYAPFGPATSSFAAAASATRTPPGAGTARRPTMPAAPQPGAPIAAPSRTRSRGRVVQIVLGLIVALIVGAVVQHMLNPTYHVPDSIAGEPRLNNSVSAKFEQTMTQTGQQNDIPLESAVYGTDTSPDLFFVLANGRAEENADELFSEFLSGAESAGIKVDQAATVTGSHDGAEYRCVPMSAQGIEAAACVWREDHSVGMTLDTSPGGDITSAVVAAYDATHA
jgi:hypothetical protein